MEVYFHGNLVLRIVEVTSERIMFSIKMDILVQILLSRKHKLTPENCFTSRFFLMGFYSSIELDRLIEEKVWSHLARRS